MKVSSPQPERLNKKPTNNNASMKYIGYSARQTHFDYLC